MRRALAISGLLAALAPGLARAHIGADPNLNNRYIKLDLSKDRVRVVYTVYFGDAPALELRARMDDNHDSQLSDAEQAAFGQRLREQVAPTLRFEVDRAHLGASFYQSYVGIGVPSTRAGSFSVDLVLEYPLEEIRSHQLYFDHAWEPDLPGETEAFIQAEPGLRVVAAHPGRHGTGVTTQWFWKGSAALSGDDRSITVQWLDDAAPDRPPREPGQPGGGSFIGMFNRQGPPPWWLELSHRYDLGAAGAILMMVIALVLGALDAAAPARLRALETRAKVVPISDALARTLLVAIGALPVARLGQQIEPVQAVGLAAATVMAALGAITLVLARRPDVLAPETDALKSASRSPAIWAALALCAYAARAPMAILLCALFAAGNLLASAALATPQSRQRLADDSAGRTRRAATIASGAAILVFALGLLALVVRAYRSTNG